jgi:hypothetical protein
MDAMHTYNVESVVDRNKPSTLQVAWSDNGLKAVVVLDHYLHAVFDFEAHRGYCCANFPKPFQGWCGHEWSDAAIDLFR